MHYRNTDFDAFLISGTHCYLIAPNLKEFDMPIKTRSILHVSVLIAVFSTCVACAVAETKPEPSSASPQNTAMARELTDSTCGEYLDLLERVKQEQKQPIEMQKSQDDLVGVMLWLHGYISGRIGIDNTARPLNKEWISTHVIKLADVCAKDESKRIIDIAAGVN